MSASDPPAHGAHEATLRPPRWGMGDAAVGWFVAQTLAVLGASLVLAASGHTDTAAAMGQGALDIVSDVTGRALDAPFVPLGLVAVMQVFLWGGLLGAPLVVARRKGNGVVQDFGLRFRPTDVPLGLAVGVACQFLLVPLVSLPWLEVLGKSTDDLSESAQQLADKATDPVGVVLLVLIVVIGAPVVEELFFRGLLLRSVERRFGAVLGVVLSSLVFALTHFQVLQFPALAAFGAVLALLAVRTGRLGPGIVAHLAFNATTVVVLLTSS